MAREHYRNGDSVGLVECGCDGCRPVMINGVLCHERGCPMRWRDYEAECIECGLEFYRTERGQIVCGECLSEWEDYHGD